MQERTKAQLYGAADIVSDAVGSFAIWCEVMDKHGDAGPELEAIAKQAKIARKAMKKAKELLSA